MLAHKSSPTPSVPLNPPSKKPIAVPIRNQSTTTRKCAVAQRCVPPTRKHAVVPGRARPLRLSPRLSLSHLAMTDPASVPQHAHSRERCSTAALSAGQTGKAEKQKREKKGGGPPSQSGVDCGCVSPRFAHRAVHRWRCQVKWGVTATWGIADGGRGAARRWRRWRACGWARRWRRCRATRSC